MSLVLYRARVRRAFHRIPSLTIPLAVTLVWVAYDLASMQYHGVFLFPARLSHVEELFSIPLAVGVAALGMDSSDGLLPVLLARPLRRSSVVLAYWAALGTVGTFWLMLHLMGQWGLVLATAYPTPQISDLLFNALDRVSLSFGVAAVMVCLSTRLPAYGNLIAWAVLYFLAVIVIPGWKTPETRELILAFSGGMEGLLTPMLHVRRTFAATPVSWFRLATYLSNVSLLLLLAIYIFNRREVSYASR